MLFQYQIRAEPVTVPAPIPVPDFFAPGFPDQVPHRRTLDPGGHARFVHVPAPVVVPEFWTPGFPDRVPHRFPLQDPGRAAAPFASALPTLSDLGVARGIFFPIFERTSGRYQAQLVSSDGVTPLPGTLLQTLRLTLYVIAQDDLTLTIVNGRNKQSVLNQADVTVSVEGLLTWTLQPADTTLVDPTLPFERHLALFEWTWAGGAGKQEVIVIVYNLRRVP